MFLWVIRMLQYKRMFQKELTLVNQINQNNAQFLIIGISTILAISLNHIFAMNFNDVAIKGSDYRIHFGYTSKDDVINTIKNSDLN